MGGAQASPASGPLIDRGEPRPMAEATQERKLLRVGSSALFGPPTLCRSGRQVFLWLPSGLTNPLGAREFRWVSPQVLRR